MKNKKKVLVAPLDWGMGHTTRCLQIIKHLLLNNWDVYVAAEGASLKRMTDTYPEVKPIEIKGYQIRYSKYAWAFRLKIISQIPKILSAIKHEKKWLKKQYEQYKFDCIISDNRYGLYHPFVYSIIMTHQLQILSGWGKIADFCLRMLHYKIIRHFNKIWIVDNETNPLAGKLSHPPNIPSNARYIGILPQFDNLTVFPTNLLKQQKKHILLLLSGPEPMRTRLETKLIKQIRLLQSDDYFFEIAAGNIAAKTPINMPSNTIYHKQMYSEQLAKAIQKAYLVICRSGYSTLMDLFGMQRKALIIPTPGQTEQLYLAQYLNGKYGFQAIKQRKISLNEILNKIEKDACYNESRFKKQSFNDYTALTEAIKEINVQ